MSPEATGVEIPRKLKILLVTRSYPARGDLYRYPFVHRRVLAHRAAGHEIAVFRPSAEEVGSYRFEGVECAVGDARALGAVAAGLRPDVLAVHGLGPAMWPIVERLAGSIKWAAWLHGSELPGFLGRKCVIDGMPASVADERAAQCASFWRELLALPSAPARLVFPSETAVGYMTESVPSASGRCAVIPNPIDDDLFAYMRKPPDQRFRLLFIRPFDSRCYANDVAVQAIGNLARDESAGFAVRMFGDGPLFDETIEPLRGLPGISIERRFLTQSEIAGEHRRGGIFLVPTRLDTQGVSRDEAMCSGLVPVTTAIEPVTGFVDESCAMLTPPEDAGAVVAAVRRLADQAELFASMSEAAARNVRLTRNSQSILRLDEKLLRAVIES